jgi:hypothetical protein
VGDGRGGEILKERERQHGRPSCKWEDNNKMNVRGIGR